MGDTQGENADDYTPEEWDNYGTFLEIRKKRNTVQAAFYAWENTGVENEALGNLLRDIFVNKWQLLGGEALDPALFFGSLAPRHPGTFLRAVIKVSPFSNMLYITNFALTDLGEKSLVTKTPVSLQNFPEMFSYIVTEKSTKLDLSRENRFTIRILEASKGHVHDTCLLKLGEVLLGFDLYTHALETAADTLAEEQSRPENSAASLGLNALNISTIVEEKEELQDKRETVGEYDYDSGSEREIEHETEAETREQNFTAEGLQNHEESGDFDFGTIYEAKKYEETTRTEFGNESDEEAEELANENFLASVKIHRMTTRKTGEFTGREIEQARKQIRTHLSRQHLDIAVLSVTGKKYRNQLAPFIHVKVASQAEAASLVKLAVLDRRHRVHHYAEITQVH
eukprot:gene27967-34576_t